MNNSNRKEYRKKRQRAKPIVQIRIANERIHYLFNEAEKAAKSGKPISFANRYVALARKIGMRYNVRIPRHLRRLYCKKCKKYLYPGITAQQRIKNKSIRIRCLSCNKTTFRQFSNKTKSQ